MGATLGFWTPVSRPSGGCESEDKLFPLLMGLSFLICMVGTGPSESSPPGWPSGPGPRSGRNQRPGLGGGGLPRRRGGVVRWAESGPSQSGAACEEPPSAWGSVALGGGGVGVNSGQVRERGQWPELGGPWTEGRSWGALGPCFSLRTLSQWPRIYWRWLECKYSLPLDRCDPTSLPPGPPTGRWPLPLSRRRREMSSNKEQRSAVFVVLFALITILILYSSNSANEVFHYGSLRGRTRRPVNLKKWSITDAYVPILGNKTLPSRCHQCVIVTSSSHLLGTKLGPEIERAECTIRMNDAPTTGYSADVGNKTTFRVVAHSSVFRVLRRPQEFVNRTPETVFIFWGPPNKMQKPQGSLVRVIQRAGLVFPNMEAYAVSPGRMRQFDDLFRGETGKDREKSHSWLSTGWFTMVIAVELCDHVHVYGMVPPDYCSQRPRLQRMPYHYYEPKGPDECVTYIQNEHSRKGNHHRFITEKRVFSSWAQLYGITFSHPSWT